MKQESCYGTAWAEGHLQHPSEPLAPGAQLQFASRGLDLSLLTDLHMILLGMNYKDISAAFESGQSSEATTGVKRIGGAQLAPYHSAHFYECSADFRARMAALTSERINDIAQNWQALRNPRHTQGSLEYAERVVEYRREIIQNLAALARAAADRKSRVLLRAEYRMTE